MRGDEKDLATRAAFAGAGAAIAVLAAAGVILALAVGAPAVVADVLAGVGGFSAGFVFAEHLMTGGGSRRGGGGGRVG